MQDCFNDVSFGRGYDWLLQDSLYSLDYSPHLPEGTCNPSFHVLRWSPCSWLSLALWQEGLAAWPQAVVAPGCVCAERQHCSVWHFIFPQWQHIYPYPIFSLSKVEASLSVRATVLGGIWVIQCVRRTPDHFCCFPYHSIFVRIHHISSGSVRISWENLASL